MGDSCYVYFAAWEDGPIKVGISSSPTNRLAGLQTGAPYPMQLLGTILFSDRQIASREEAGILNHWRHQRQHGEWILRSPEFLDYVQQRLASSLPVEPTPPLPAPPVILASAPPPVCAVLPAILPTTIGARLSAIRRRVLAAWDIYSGSNWDDAEAGRRYDAQIAALDLQRDAILRTTSRTSRCRLMRGYAIRSAHVVAVGDESPSERIQFLQDRREQLGLTSQ